MPRLESFRRRGTRPARSWIASEFRASATPPSSIRQREIGVYANRLENLSGSRHCRRERGEVNRSGISRPGDGEAPRGFTAIATFSRAENFLHSSVLVVRGRSAGIFRSRIISRPRVTSNAMAMATRNHRCDDAHDVLARRPRRRTRNVLASRCYLRCRSITHLNILRAFCRHHEKMLFTKERSRRANR